MGHFDHERLDDDLWHGEAAEPIAGAWPVIEIDTTVPVDERRLVEVIRQHLEVH